MDDLDYIVRRTIKQVLQRWECPRCGHKMQLCEYPDCIADAVYEGWEGQGLIRRRRYCEIHAVNLRGHKNENI